MLLLLLISDEISQIVLRVSEVPCIAVDFSQLLLLLQKQSLWAVVETRYVCSRVEVVVFCHG